MMRPIHLLIVATFAVITHAFKLSKHGTATVTYDEMGSNYGACDCATGMNKYPVAGESLVLFGLQR